VIVVGQTTPPDGPRTSQLRLGTRGKLLTARVVGLLSLASIVAGFPAMLVGGWRMPRGFALADLGALGLSWTFKPMLGASDT
jgi:hypothetical protein